MQKKGLFLILIFLFSLISIEYIYAPQQGVAGESCFSDGSCLQYHECYEGKCAYVEYGSNYLGFINCGDKFGCTEDRVYCLSQSGSTLKKCKTNYFCDTDALGASCFPKRLETQPCSENSMCLSNVCNNWKCKTVNGIGALRKDGETCSYDYDCESEQCDNGMCAIRYNTGKVGDRCSQSSQCESQKCNFVDSNKGYCGDDQNWAGPCRLSSNDPEYECSSDTKKCILGNNQRVCAEGFYCACNPQYSYCESTAYGNDDRTYGCFEKKANSLSCDLHNECQSGYCTQEGFCVTPKPNGATCYYNSECQSEKCDTGVCVSQLSQVGWIGNCPSSYTVVCGCASDNACKGIGSWGFCSSSSNKIKNCASGYYCGSSDGDNACILKKQNGVVCDSGIECQSSYCVSGVCSAGFSDDGETCDDGSDCDSGSCVLEKCVSNNYLIGACLENSICSSDVYHDKCIIQPASGSDIIQKCAQGHYCVYGFFGYNGGGCFEKKNDGAICTWDYECKGVGCDGGTCRGLDVVTPGFTGTSSCDFGYKCSGDKTKCVFRTQDSNMPDKICATTNYCTDLILEGSGQNPLATCANLKKNIDASCTDPYECQSENCVDSKCAAPLPVEGVSSVCGTIDKYSCSGDYSKCESQDNSLPLKICESNHYCDVRSRGEGQIDAATCMSEKKEAGFGCANNYECQSNNCLDGVCRNYCSVDSDCGTGGNCYVSTGSEIGLCLDSSYWVGDCGNNFICSQNKKGCIITSSDDTTPNFEGFVSDVTPAGYQPQTQNYKLCATGYYCDSNSCVEENPEGTVCSLAVECASGICGDDGFCEGGGVETDYPGTGSCGLFYLCSTDKTKCVSAVSGPDKVCSSGYYCGSSSVDIGFFNINVPSCLEKKITGDCTIDAECVSSNCGDNNQCVLPAPTCQDNTDCPVGTECQTGDCVSTQECSSDDECLPGSSCTDSVCVSQPCVDTTCPSGSQCQGGSCVPFTCDSTNDCQDGYACQLFAGDGGKCISCGSLSNIFGNNDVDNDGKNDCEDPCVGSSEDQCTDENIGISCSSVGGITCNTGSDCNGGENPSVVELNCCVPDSDTPSPSCSSPSIFIPTLGSSVKFEKNCVNGQAQVTVKGFIGDSWTDVGNANEEYSKLGITSNPYIDYNDYSCNTELTGGSAQPVYGYGLLSLFLSLGMIGIYYILRKKK